MKQLIQKILISVVGLCASISAYAYDFEVDGFGYTITSFADLTVRIDRLVDDNATKVIIPESVEYKNKSLKVTDIAAGAFAGKTALIEVSWPNTISYIPEEAFNGCTSLKVINFSSDIKEIGEFAFGGCTSLTSFSIPDSVQDIEDGVFSGCKSLTKIDLHSRIKSIGSYAFCRTGLQTFNIPDSVRVLGSSVFEGSKLVEIYIPDRVYVNSDCFKGCKELRNITFSSSKIRNGKFPKGIFSGCSALQRITLPENLVSIGAEAFRDCESLTELYIPSGVEYVSPSILYGCSSLSKLTIGNGLAGIPFEWEYVYRWNDRVNCVKVLTGYYDYKNMSGKTYLQGLKEFIIEDSNEDFSIKGTVIDDTVYPLFANTELDYYYVGRPLVDIDKWTCRLDDGDGYYSKNYKVENFHQGTGRIGKLEIGGGCTSVPYFYQKIDTLKLGENVKEFDLDNIYKEDIVQIECLANVPPKIVDVKSNFPTKVYTDAALYVPSGCKEAYENVDVWKNFWNIYEIGSGESSGISDVFDKENGGLYDVYNVAGLLIGKSFDMAKIKKLPKGIYILTNKSKQCKIRI